MPFFSTHRLSPGGDKFTTLLEVGDLRAQLFQYNPLAILRICKPHEIAKWTQSAVTTRPRDSDAFKTVSYWRGNYPIIQPGFGQ